MPEPVPTPTPTAPAGGPATTPAEGSDDGKGGKSAILADLATERDRRQALETQVADLTSRQATQAAALAKAFGVTTEETSDVTKLAGQVTALQEQFAATQRANAVLSVANEHGITSTEDLALLGSVTDEPTMRTLAARIKATAGPGPAGPRPDLTQGGHGGTQGGTPAQDFASFIKNQLRA